MLFIAYKRGMAASITSVDENDPFDLARFVSAQADDFNTALAEIRDGRKRSHWMWYIFPQFAGLGLSEMSRRYAIRSVEEARAYLAHPLLGPRLVRCTVAAMEVEGRSATEIFGSPDDTKLRSSSTLFAKVSTSSSVFEQLLDRYFDGHGDPQTLRLMEAAESR